MLGLPARTEISKSIYKKDLLKRFNGTPAQREVFNGDIESIKIVNEISSRSIQIEESENIKAIFVLLVETKKQEISENTIQKLFDLINQKIIVVIKHGDKYRYSIKHIKVFSSEWLEIGYELNIDGIDLSEVWESFVVQLANIKVEKDNSLEAQIELDERRQKLLKEIEKLEKKAWKEKQPRKKFELAERLKVLKNQLLELD